MQQLSNAPDSGKLVHNSGGVPEDWRENGMSAHSIAPAHSSTLLMCVFDAGQFTLIIVFYSSLIYLKCKRGRCSSRDVPEGSCFMFIILSDVWRRSFVSFVRVRSVAENEWCFGVAERNCAEMSKCSIFSNFLGHFLTATG